MLRFASIIRHKRPRHQNPVPRRVDLRLEFKGLPAQSITGISGQQKLRCARTLLPRRSSPTVSRSRILRVSEPRARLKGRLLTKSRSRIFFPMHQSVPRLIPHRKLNPSHLPSSCSRSLLAKLRSSAGAPAFPVPPAHRHITVKHPALAPTQKSLYSPLHHSSSANIASQRTEAIQRHLSTGSPPSTSTMSYGKGSSEYSSREIAPKHTLDYRCYLEQNGKPVSPFHDIPLYANEQQTILNMIVEIPRWSNAKLEVRNPYDRSWAIVDKTNRSPRKSGSTLSSKTSRRASSDSFATASLTRATSGTTVPSQEYVLHCDGKSDILTTLTDLGGPQCCSPRDQGQGRQ